MDWYAIGAGLNVIVAGGLFLLAVLVMLRARSFQGAYKRMVFLLAFAFVLAAGERSTVVYERLVGNTVTMDLTFTWLTIIVLRAGLAVVLWAVNIWAIVAVFRTGESERTLGEDTNERVREMQTRGQSDRPAEESDREEGRRHRGTD